MPKKPKKVIMERNGTRIHVDAHRVNGYLRSGWWVVKDPPQPKPRPAASVPLEPDWIEPVETIE